MLHLLTASQPHSFLRSLVIAGALTCLLVASSFAADSKDPSNVTAAVAAEVKDGHLVVAASNDKFGDTAPGVPKKLKVDYKIGNDVFSREAAEGGQIDVTAPAGQTLVVVKAVYGPADGSAAGAPGDVSDDPSALLDVPPGFKIEHVLRSNSAKSGSWINMTKDPKGRLLLGGQRGQAITRLTIQDGKCVKEEVLHIPVSETMGMLFVDNVLYLNGNGKHGFALYRCKDTKGDDSYDDVEFLREWHGGAGEHGAHALVLGPDRKLYAVCGNFTAIPKDLVPSSPHRVYADDLALKRMDDGNGFGAGNPPPGGFVARMDLDGTNCELFASGERNTYDIAFNADGELFGFDSDMEWDWGSPWYRPIRVFHAVRGGDQGFREGSGKWPEYYADSLPASVTIGIGCPTGVGFGYGAKFPAAYQKALYICDWTYGRLIAVHLKPNGATYGGTWENFVAPKSLHTKQRKTPLNMTDELIGEDGSLYFVTGGRGTVADLFRVSYTGSDAATPIAAAQLHETEGADARAQRHKLEAFNVAPDPTAVDAAWTDLGSPDRFVRYAARLAIERNPVESWQAKALAEKRPMAAFTALLALARLGGADVQAAIVKAISSFPSLSLTEEQLLFKLRVLEVTLSRQGIPTGDTAHVIIADLDPLYPAKTEFLNRELCQVLLALNAPDAVAKTVALMKAATSQEEQLTYVADLRNIKTGWTLDLRRAYLAWWDAGRSNEHPPGVVQWFTDAGIGFNNGSSFKNLIAHALKDAKASLSPEEVAALGDLNQPQVAAKAPTPARTFVKDWTTADLQPLLNQVNKGRDFARGKAGFEAGQCILCHRYGDQGGSVGPDLTSVSTRFKRQDILESITEPSKVVSEQYMNTVFTMNDGSFFIGRIAQDTGKTLQIIQNPLVAATTPINKADIKSRDLSKISPMPPGLLNTFTKEEILDLLAYLECMGDPKHPDFAK